MEKSFNVFANTDGKAVAVKSGWSWPAFFFGMWWALFNRLWGLAVLILLINIVSNLASEEFFYLESTMGVITVIAVNLSVKCYIGARGNEWRERDLVSRGFAHQGAFEAEHADYAVGEWMRSNAVTHGH